MSADNYHTAKSLKIHYNAWVIVLLLGG